MRKWRVANKDIIVSVKNFSVMGLEEGNEYEFRVTAENKAGCGTPSEPSRPVKYGMANIYVHIQYF